jgi:hypothetical protein
MDRWTGRPAGPVGYELLRPVPVVKNPDRFHLLWELYYSNSSFSITTRLFLEINDLYKT